MPKLFLFLSELLLQTFDFLGNFAFLVFLFIGLRLLLILEVADLLIEIKLGTLELIYPTLSISKLLTSLGGLLLSLFCFLFVLLHLVEALLECIFVEFALFS